MIRGGVLLASIAFRLVGSSVVAQDRKGIRFWNPPCTRSRLSSV
jgi:hypothetical protein